MCNLCIGISCVYRSNSLAQPPHLHIYQVNFMMKYPSLKSFFPWMGGRWFILYPSLVAVLIVDSTPLLPSADRVRSVRLCCQSIPIHSCNDLHPSKQRHTWVTAALALLGSPPPHTHMSRLLSPWIHRSSPSRQCTQSYSHTGAAGEKNRKIRGDTLILYCIVHTCVHLTCELLMLRGLEIDGGAQAIEN